MGWMMLRCKTLRTCALRWAFPACCCCSTKGENAPEYAGTVSLDLAYVGWEMASMCDYGYVFIVGGNGYSTATQTIEESLLYDGDYGIAKFR